MRKTSNKTAMEFQEKLAALGIVSEVVEFEETTRTAKDAARAIGCELGQIVKSLIFRTKKSGRAVLVLASGVNRVDEALIRAQIGEKLGKADADFVRESTGYAIGGVPPFGHRSQLPVYVDEDFFQYETIWAAAGTPNAVFQLTPDELVGASQGTVCKVSQGEIG
jgi:Cys-tRNA(Pro) deacylase